MGFGSNMPSYRYKKDGSIGVSGRSNIINVSMLFMTGVSDIEYLRR
jgi:hypothetical protein